MICFTSCMIHGIFLERSLHAHALETGKNLLTDPEDTLTYANHVLETGMTDLARSIKHILTCYRQELANTGFLDRWGCRTMGYT